VFQGPLTKLLYVGTVSKAKMHAATAEIFAALSSQGFGITVVGGPDHLALRQEVEALGGRIETVGWRETVQDFYRDADLFIYPLRSDHYGTGEQVLLEAMAAGLPAVAFNNPAEAEIVEPGKTGLLAHSVAEFLDAVREISSAPRLYEEMSMRAQARVVQTFDAEAMARQLIAYVLGALADEKVTPPPPIEPRSRSLNELETFALNSFFDERLAGELLDKTELEGAAALFSHLRPTLEVPEVVSRWTAHSKSSPFHYLRYFPASIGLRELTTLIESVPGVVGDAQRGSKRRGNYSL
jgi:hypothetical protein